MTRALSAERITSTGLALLVFAFVGIGQSQAQVRGVYPLGMSATNSGVTPDDGFTYSNQLLIYSRDELKDADGNVTATGKNSVIMDMNTVAWVSKKETLHGGRFSMTATIPIANNSLTSDVTGDISGGSGLADSYYQPFILGWEQKRSAIRAVYGFLAPTGSFQAGGNNNVGSGYWTHAFSSGQSFYLTESKATVLSTFQMYEVHTTQKDTKIHPGQTMNLDYSLMQSVLAQQAWSLQVGMVGYGQWQTTDKEGPGITPEQANAHYRVYALGAASNVGFPNQRASLGFKYFKEFANRSTFQGYSVQVSGSIHF
jgi:hypothetical protein